jgi:hypothetical protein
MTTKSVGAPRIFGQGVYQDYPVIASDIIYEGSAVGENASGYSRPLVAGDPFQGFAVDKDYDNSDGSAGDINVRVISQGIACNLPVTGATAITANDFPPVYASDDNTFTLTAGSNTSIGNVIRWVSSGVCDVWFDVPRGPATIVAADIGTGAVETAKIAADAVDGTKIADDAISVEHLDDGILPSHVVKFAAEVTWTGGLSTLAVTVTGALATDIVQATFHTLGTEGTIIQGAVASSDTVTLTLDAANTSNDAVIAYVVYRAAA